LKSKEIENQSQNRPRPSRRAEFPKKAAALREPAQRRLAAPLSMHQIGRLVGQKMEVDDERMDERE
jgi:hypothetical protein